MGDSMTNVSNNIPKTALNRMKGTIIFHGTPSALELPIDNKHSFHNDFGAGFYTSTDIEFAESMSIKNNTNGLLYYISYSLDNLTVFNFERDIELWMLYIAANRGVIKTDEYRKLHNKIEEINKYDVVIGKISDDRSAYIYNQFYIGAATDICVEEYLNYYNLGDQIVFKSQRACKNLAICDVLYNTDIDRNRIMHDKSVRLGKAVSIVEDLKRKYENTGTRINTLLEKYR